MWAFVQTSDDRFSIFADIYVSLSRWVRRHRIKVTRIVQKQIKLCGFNYRAGLCTHYATVKRQCAIPIRSGACRCSGQLHLSLNEISGYSERQNDHFDLSPFSMNILFLHLLSAIFEIVNAYVIAGSLGVRPP